MPFPVVDGAGRDGVRVLAGRADGFRAADFLGVLVLVDVNAIGVALSRARTALGLLSALGIVTAFGRRARLRLAGVGMNALIRADGSFEVRLRGTGLHSAPWRSAVSGTALGFEHHHVWRVHRRTRRQTMREENRA